MYSFQYPANSSLAAKSPTAMTPQAPPNPCTHVAPTASSTLRYTKRGSVIFARRDPTAPIIKASNIVITAQPARKEEEICKCREQFCGTLSSWKLFTLRVLINVYTRVFIFR